MARIRSIKPEFWESEKVAKLPALDALTFIGLISLADDHGKGRGEVRGVFGRVHPMRPGVTFRVLRRAFNRLESVGLVRFWDHSDGCSYYWIKGFSEHQKIDRPSPSKFPDPPPLDEPSTNPRRTLNEQSPLDQGSGIKEGNGRDQGGEDSPPLAFDLASRPSAGLVPMFKFCKSPGPKAKADALDDLLRQGVETGRIANYASSPDHRTWDFYDIVKALRPQNGKATSRPDPLLRILNQQEKTK